LIAEQPNTSEVQGTAVISGAGFSMPKKKNAPLQNSPQKSQRQRITEHKFTSENRHPRSARSDGDDFTVLATPKKSRERQ